MNNAKLEKQIQFIIEIDKLKHVFRRTLLINGSRNENDAEHSWHLAVMSLLLQEYSSKKDIDISRVIKMLLVHDIVEIDAGDTFCYDMQANKNRKEREEKAADRIFNILPKEQASELRQLWDEFEERKTPEARFAASLDRLQPLLHNYNTKGKAWKEHKVTSDMVFERNKYMKDGSPVLWEYAEAIINDSIQKGYLNK